MSYSTPILVVLREHAELDHSIRQGIAEALDKNKLAMQAAGGEEDK